MEDLDRDELLRLLDLRLDSVVGNDDAMCRYFEGRIDGHCLQNAISDDELHALASEHGYRIGWNTAMEQVA